MFSNFTRSRYSTIIFLRVIRTGGASALLFRGHRRQYLVIGILLMMICVQSLSVHFHFSGADGAPHSSHTHGSLDADQFDGEHAGETCADSVAAVAWPTLAIAVLLPALLAVVGLPASTTVRWTVVRNARTPYHLLFFSPPLRAPPHHA